MDKRSKEALRRYKKSRQQSSSESSSSSDSDSSGSSYSSSDSERHRRKKARQATGGSSRRSSSSSTEERRKREKREHCQKKLEAKRIHLKRKLKEAKLKKRAAAAAAALSGHIGHRSLSPTTQAKLKKLAERKHQRAASKERREREREKHRAAIAREREREREHHRTGSRSPTKITKIRIHQDVKRQKSPPRMHHTMMSREKIIIQTRTREHTPSPSSDRRHDPKIRHDDLVRERERRDRERDRAEREREAARDKERAEALARCQERQRERERLAREKLRREEEEKKYGGMSIDRGERLLPRPAERELAIAASRGYNSRERSLEAIERTRIMSKRNVDVYEREREYMEAERRTLINREDIRRDREYMPARRRELSPINEHYSACLRDQHDIYAEEGRDRVYNRAYIEEGHIGRERETPWPREMRERELHDIRDTREQRETRDPREYRDMENELIYPDERERLIRNRERVREEWKNDWDVNREQEWNDAPPITGRGGFIGGPKRNAPLIGSSSNPGVPKIAPREQRAPSEPDWDNEETQKNSGSNINKVEPTIIREGSNFGMGSSQREAWNDHDHHEIAAQRETPLAPARTDPVERRWQNDWRENEDTMQRMGPIAAVGNIPPPLHHHRSERGGRSFRRGGSTGGIEHGERNGQGLRTHPPPLMTLPVQPPAAGFIGGNPRFPNKNKMTYTNPNIIKKQHAVMAAAKAAQASAVAAASTAVAAAKAAAQSAANATTNPSILGQASNLTRQQHEPFVMDEKPEAGEILPDTDSKKKMDMPTINKKTDNFLPLGNPIVNNSQASGELSEISDSDDDILNKGDKKSRTETDDDSTMKVDVISEQEDLTRSNDDTGIVDEKHDDEEILDFEEISDGELEEDSRNKGVGDALGVDWASLIAESKLQTDNAITGANEQPTTAKQKWQPHRIILDIGISLSMAGENYAKKLLTESKQKLADEIKEIKTNIKVEETQSSNKDNNLKNSTDGGEIVEVKIEPVDSKPVDGIDVISFNFERLQPLACLQVGERIQRLERQNIISNACGSYSRALSARQDLKLRRKICNLPAREFDFPNPPPINAKIKAMAFAAFQRTLEVK